MLAQYGGIRHTDTFMYAYCEYMRFYMRFSIALYAHLCYHTSRVRQFFKCRQKRLKGETGEDETKNAFDASFTVLFSSCHFIIVGPGLHADSAVNFSDLHLHEGV